MIYEWEIILVWSFFQPLPLHFKGSKNGDDPNHGSCPSKDFVRVFGELLVSTVSSRVVMQLFDIVCDLDISAKASSMLDTVSQYVKIVMMFTEDPVRTNAACILLHVPTWLNVFNMLLVKWGITQTQHISTSGRNHPNIVFHIARKRGGWSGRGPLFFFWVGAYLEDGATLRIRGQLRGLLLPFIYN